MDSKSSTHSSRRKSQASMQRVPPSVEAVLEFGYPKDLVLSTYHQLSTGSFNTDAQPGNEEAEGASGGVSIPTFITAALLMTTLETILGRSTASGNNGSHSRSQGPGVTNSTMTAGAWADNDMEEDGPDDKPEVPPSTGSIPAPALGSPEQPDPTANTVETIQGSIETPSSSTAGVLPSSSTHTDVPAGDEGPVETSSTSTSTPPASTTNTGSTSAKDTSGPTSVSLASPIPSSEPTPPEQPSQSRIPAVGACSRYSSPPGAGVSESHSSPAEERARERKRLLTRLRGLREENRRLKARQMCRHCHQRPVELTLLPCGHFIYCQTCGSSFDTCPACKKTVLADVKTFLA